LNISDLELKPEQLRRQNDPAIFAFKSTAELPSLEQIIGQDRAIDAIDFGVDMPSQGYNIFAVGPAGSGRTTAVRQFLNKRASQRAVPWEWCYVYNFYAPRRPKAIDLPSGRASLLREQMAALIEQARHEMPRAFEGEHYEQRRREIVLDVQKKQRDLYQGLEQYLDERNFALIRSQMGLAIAPVLNGETLSAEDYQKLEPDVRKGFEDRRPELQEQFDKTMRETRELDRQAKQAIGDINSELAGFVVDNLMAEIEKEFGDCSKVLDYLNAVRKDMVENVSHFLPSSEEENQILSALRQSPEKSWFRRYIINVLGEAGERTCAPVIIEDNPTYHNLIGRIEHRAEFGAMVTDFTQIQAGALHRANGGYLVVEAKICSPTPWLGKGSSAPYATRRSRSKRSPSSMASWRRHPCSRNRFPLMSRSSSSATPTCTTSSTRMRRISVTCSR
jgi:predicted ATP-dependent protease